MENMLYLYQKYKKLLEKNLFSFYLLITTLCIPHFNQYCKKLVFKTKIKSRRTTLFRRRPTGKRNSSAPLLNPATLYQRTGVFPDTFLSLYNKIHPSLVEPRGKLIGKHRTKTKLHSMDRLMLALEFLRSYPSYSILSRTYGVSKSFISKEIKHVLPKLYLVIQNETKIDWSPSPLIGLDGAIGAVDCSTHYRHRVHPGQANYYRFDKHGFFLTAQLVCGLDGRMFSLDIGLGHNNDSGMLILTGKISGNFKFKLRVNIRNERICNKRRYQVTCGFWLSIERQSYYTR